MNTDNEFDKIISKMTGSGPTMPKQSNPITGIFGMLATICVVSVAGGTLVMLINMIINNAYPNLDDFRPGIGFYNASRLFLLTYVVMAIYGALNRTQKNS